MGLAGETARRAAIEATDEHIKKVERLQEACADLLRDATDEFPEVVASYRATDSWFEISSESDYDVKCDPSSKMLKNIDLLLRIAKAVYGITPDLIY